MDVNVVGAYIAERSGPGFQIVGPDGDVMAWTTTEKMAVTVVALLNLAHEVGLVDQD